MANGTISSFTAKTDRLVVKVGTRSDSFMTTAMTKVDLGGKTSTLAKLKAGDKVTVTHTTTGKTLTATSLAATAQYQFDAEVRAVRSQVAR
jgi:predicted amino acid racemase